MVICIAYIISTIYIGRNYLSYVSCTVICVACHTALSVCFRHISSKCILLYRCSVCYCIAVTLYSRCCKRSRCICCVGIVCLCYGTHIHIICILFKGIVTVFHIRNCGQISCRVIAVLYSVSVFICISHCIPGIVIDIALCCAYISACKAFTCYITYFIIQIVCCKAHCIGYFLYKPHACIIIPCLVACFTVIVCRSMYKRQGDGSIIKF